MAKSKTPRRPTPAPDADFMQKIARLREEMKQAHEQLAEERITVTAGGDAVKVTIDGKQRLHRIVVSPDALAQGDVEMLQDLLVVAVNNAIEQSQTLAAERLRGLAGGLGLPGM